MDLRTWSWKRIVCLVGLFGCMAIVSTPVAWVATFIAFNLGVWYGKLLPKPPVPIVPEVPE